MDTLIESILVSRQTIPEESLDDIIDSVLGLLNEDELDALLSEVGCREVVSIVASNVETLLQACCCNYHLTLNILKLYVVRQLYLVSQATANSVV